MLYRILWICLGFPPLARARRCTWESEEDAGIAYTKDPWHFTVESSCKHLATQSIGDLRMGDDGVTAFCAAIVGHKEVSAIDLQGNAISDVGAVALAEALKSLPALSWLGISGNGIGQHGAIALAQALRGATELDGLDVGFNSFGSVGDEALSDAVAHVEAMRGTPRLVDVYGIDGDVVTAARQRAQASSNAALPPRTTAKRNVPGHAPNTILGALRKKCAHLLNVARAGDYMEDLLGVLGVSDLETLLLLEVADIEEGLKESAIPVLQRKQLRKCFAEVASSPAGIEL